ncbi:cell surface protein SprA, partial [Bacteroidales bacterium OttesenSCG-928-M11]|nr:cell surface protein SprA [Bacteroidales bacterium OttesenSCG-928-M11]
MKKNQGKYYIIGIVLVLMGSIFSLNAKMPLWSIMPETNPFETENPQDEIVVETKQEADTLPPRFPVSPIIPEKEEDLKTIHPIDLRNPSNFKNDFEYNPLTNRYELKSKIGGSDLRTPISLTTEEYFKYSLDRSMNSYYLTRNKEDNMAEEGKAGEDVLGDYAFQFDLGPAEKLFGPGGVKLQAQGSTLLKMGIVNNISENPTLSERERNKTTFDFDAQIQASVDASVGDKINFTLNYNTESTFDFDSKQLKLAYTGKEDEIIKTLEAGNVSMTTSNSLIRGGTSLFGVKGEFQFGKLTLGVLFSQQESQSRTTKSKGNVQTTPFEVAVDNYDENMHYFLAHYFRDTYDKSLSTNPYIRSGITIEEIEVWVTNKRSNYDDARNIVAFSDLAEYSHISNDNFVQPSGSSELPYNRANNLYSNLVNSYSGARDINNVTSILSPVMSTGKDFEKVENARKLTTSEYILNKQLGYISLRTKLQADEVLAVAFTYTYKGEVYEVGELSSKNTGNTSDNLYLKMLKGTSVSPNHPTWDLMMKNVYTIISSSSRSLEKDKFRLDIKYKSDTTGVYMNYLTEGAIANVTLLSVMNLDKLDSNNNSYPDGFFDYVEGNTVLSSQGRIIFPVVEPFGDHLRKKIGDDEIAGRYIYQELYDSTLTIARQNAEKNKFILTGEYKGSGSSSISLDGYNISQGSVAVYANGVLLKENSDYTINYTTGEVTITNPSYVNADITTQSENKSSFGMQRKTMMGMNLNYAFSPNFNMGATIMNLNEMPLTLKNLPGEESVNNTIWGLNMNYTTQSYWLTNLLDKLPFVDLTAPSQISLNAEYAQLKPGHYSSEYGGDYSYIDDFESAKNPIDIRSPHYWYLSSTPSMFAESGNTNDLSYGNNRALLAWYQIDPLFTRKSPLTPTHIKNDLDQLSNHYVREVNESELFPGKDINVNGSSTVSILNLAYYPKERGPYNLDSHYIDPDGTLMNPTSRWGGIYRKIESSQTNFEEQNVEYIEFWLLDPFIYEPHSKGGELYFNLGEVSEDILKDGKKFFENGVPIDGNKNKMDSTAWGLVPNTQSLTYAFDVNGQEKQDVGLNGLSTEQEFEFPAYKNYIEELRSKLNPETIARMELDQFSPFNDPSGDNYHYYRGSDYDRQEKSILERYKRYNGTEGNSSNKSGESYSTAAQIQPDVEDVNQDNTLNENESYFQYKISITPDDLEVGRGYIVDKRETAPSLKNGKREQITWYQFKIPIKNYDQKIGNINDFSSIRFVRMFLTNFQDSTVLRFGTLELVKGEWRAYTKDLSNQNIEPTSDAAISISTVNIEENGRKEPVNYIMPPGVNQMIDPGQPQLRTQNEQSLALKIIGLSAGDARAIYKNTGLDTRQYRRLQMFVHAEKLIDDLTDLKDDELSIFLRLGSDYQQNYYEYEIPLKLTPQGHYTTENSTVWPDENMFDFPFKLLTDTKLQRNKEKGKEGSGVTFYTPYSVYDPNKAMNKVTVMGNPTLSEVKVIMIGVRNETRTVKDVEVWINELRLTDYNEDGGWAANVNAYVGLSDLGSINFSGKRETAGFGSIDQGIMDRNMDDYLFLNFSAQLEMGKFFPEKAKVNLPVYFSYSKEQYDPKYNPLDSDILLDDALEVAETKHERDSILGFARDVVTNKSFEVNNVRVNITSKKPMPYDPANFTLGYSHNIRKLQNATTEYENETDTRLLFGYSYSPMLNPWQPFNKGASNNQSSGGRNQRNTQSRGGSSGGNNFLKDFGIGLLPKLISFNSDINRNYFETQVRDVHGGGSIPASFREDFYWNRDFNLQWDLTKNLNLNLKTGTEAMIETPHEQVNKKLNMDGYEIWKDSVIRSIKSFGTPMNYDQAFTAKYTIPFKN